MVHLFSCFLILFLTAARHVEGLARCAAQAQAVTAPVLHGEGPHWDPRRQLLFFVDISNQTVHAYDHADDSVRSVFIEDGPVSPAIPSRKDNWFIVGRGRDLVTFFWDGKSERGPLQVLATVDKDKPKNRFNDGKADASGRLWIGTMGPEDPDLKLHQGSLFSFSDNQGFKPIKQVTPVSVSNGLAWSKNDTIMYYIDSPTRDVEAFDFDLQRGTLKNRRVVFSLEVNGITGVPDGMTIDEEDRLWVAVYNGGVVLHVDPANGSLLKTLTIPASRVTSCAFGGPDLGTLYVTTSRRGLTPEQLQVEPLAGSVFAIHNVGAKGQRKTNTAKT